MKTSARNQLKGTISSIKSGQVNSEVVIDLKSNVVKAVLTNEAVEEMELAVGQEVYAIIKASFVIVSKEKPGQISTRNVFETTVTDVKKGLVNSTLKLAMGDDTLSANITNEATEELEIAEGDTLYALVKASSIILAK